ncbi:MAG TPA: VCBS repeat-containing protein [Blastocatellia bacterium]|nr:VCBS repeat-containing protein [Blastocatellia bacterium]
MIRILALIMFVEIIQAPSQSPLFSPAPGSPVAVGEGPGQVVLADVNGDGHLDMVTRHLQSRIVTTQLGDGAGRFVAAPGSPIVVGYQPGDIKLGDVNNDKIPDLGVTSSDRDTVDIFLGNGKGGFSPSPGSPFTVSAVVEFYTRSLHLVDINEDGKLDIVTANRRRNTFSTLLGNGRGGFAPGPTTTFLSGQGEYIFDFGDMDGDKLLDVVTVSGLRGDFAEPSRVTLYRGDGKGAFKNASESPISAPAGAHFLTLGDMNGDRRLDVVISHSGDQLSVLSNNGAGKFSPAPGSPYNLGVEAFGVFVADVNQDRRNDLIAATVDSVMALLGDGRGFAPAPGSPFSAGPGAYNLAVGDLNEDGKLDIVASSFEGKAVTVLLGR